MAVAFKARRYVRQGGHTLVRIAGRPPMASSALSLARWWLITACVAAAGVTMFVAGPLSIERGAGSRDVPGAPLTFADTLGIGGLPSLTFDGHADDSLIDDQTIVAYYGTPRQPDMGILGEYDAETIAWMLSARAAKFDALNGDATVKPALHLVYGVAQPEAGGDGLHMRYVDDRTVRQYLAVARRYGFALILDLQIGHSDALTEARKVLPYLYEPDVHLALDPEFALAGGAAPGARIGSLAADDINAVQWLLGQVAAERGLPRKALIVHQFEAFMLPDASAIERRDDVDLIIDVDGYGPADIKKAKYASYGAAPYAPYGGIKIFLDHDPDVMSEQQLIDIQPRPVFFLYQ
jgi:hypothetical protein